MKAQKPYPMHCKVCHTEVLQNNPHLICKTLENQYSSILVPCTKECGGKPKDQIGDSSKMIEDHIPEASKKVCKDGVHTVKYGTSKCIDCGHDEGYDRGQSIKVILNESLSVKAGAGCNQEKETCQHQWFEIEKTSIMMPCSCERCIRIRKEKNIDLSNCHYDQKKSGVKVGCILCPEARIKWEDGEIEVIKKP